MDPASDFELRTYRRVTWRLVPFLFLCYVLAYLDRVNVGFAKLQMQGDLGLSEAVYGFGAGIFFIGYFLFEVPSNLILQRVGARIWIARIMIVWGLISAAMLLVRSPLEFYALRFTLGVAEAGFFPGIILYLTFWYPRAYRARMVAVFMTAVALSGVVGGPLSGFILGHLDGVSGLRGWQWLFLLEGLPTALVGLVVLGFLDDGPARARWLSEAERALLVARLDEEERHKAAVGAHHRTVAEAFRSGRVWLLAAVYFGIVMGLYGISFWLPQILEDTLTRDPWRIGLLSAIPWAVAAVAMVLAGHHSDASGERRWHVALPALVAAVGLAVSPLVGGAAGLGALTLATAGILSAAGCFWALPTAFLSGTAAAAGIAWINSVGNLAGHVSPWLVGVIRDRTGDGRLALWAIAAALAGSALLVLSGVPSRRAVAPGPPARRRGRTVALCVGSVAIALMLGELVCRQLPTTLAERQREELPWLRPGAFQPAPDVGYELVPLSAPDINVLGMRGPHATARKPEGVLRVLVLGDSIAFGIGVAAQETFAAVLEARLARRWPERRVEVLDAGVSGYNTRQELAYLERRGLGYAPDAVVLAWFWNDVLTTPVLLWEDGRLFSYRPGRRERIWGGWLFQRSALYRHVVSLGLALRWDASKHPQWDSEANFAALAALASRLQREGVPLVALLFPGLETELRDTPAERRSLHERARGILESHGARVLDLLELWADQPVAALRGRRANDFVHPGATAHREVAERLESALVDALAPADRR